jgi:hypothetical protein
VIHGFHNRVTILGLGYCVSSSFEEKSETTIREGQMVFHSFWKIGMPKLGGREIVKKSKTAKLYSP